MKEIKVKVTFTEDILGTMPNNPDIYRDYISTKGPDPTTIDDEIEAIGREEVVKKEMTIFPKTEDGIPFIYDYQIRGFFKDTCGALRRASGSESSKIKAYKKEINGLVFINERTIPINNFNTIGECQRPLRGQVGPQEIVSLASSECIKAGANIIFTIRILSDSLYNAVIEWLNYGRYRGLLQWRNSGKGRFTYEILDERKSKDLFAEPMQ